MKWLKSTSQKTWTVKGKVIPACVTPHNDYLVLNDSEYAEISNIPVIKSLINANGILVLKEEPAELKNSVENLKSDNNELNTQIANLQEQLKQKDEEIASLKQKQAEPVDIEKIKEDAVAELKAQAVAELQEKEDRIKQLEAELAEAKATPKTSRKAKSEE